MTIRYEPGDRVTLLRDHCAGDKQIAAGESGIVVRLVSYDDRRLARQLYIDVQLESGVEQRVEQIRVTPTEVKPAESRVIAL
jgi:hypothetical protein